MDVRREGIKKMTKKPQGIKPFMHNWGTKRGQRIVSGSAISAKLEGQKRPVEG